MRDFKLGRDNYYQLVKQLCEKVERRVEKEKKKTLVCGISRGGLIPAVYVAHYINSDLDVLKIHSYSGREKGEVNVEWSSISFDSLQKYERVVIVDDLVDSGDTMIMAEKLLRRLKNDIEIVKAVVFVNENKVSCIDIYSVYTYGKWIIFPYERE